MMHKDTKNYLSFIQSSLLDPRPSPSFQQTLTDLFAEPSGLDKFVKQKQQQQEEEAKAKAKAEEEASEKKESAEKKEMTDMEIEQALQAAEDEADVDAARAVKAEQKAEVAEFDENIPWDETEAAMKERSDETSKVSGLLQ